MSFSLSEIWRQYFKTFARRSLDSYEFQSDLLEFFAADSEASAALKTVDWDAWFHTPGLPPKPEFDTSLVEVCYSLASKWETTGFEPAASDIAGWKAMQVVVFLDKVQAFADPLNKQQTQKLGATYGFLDSKNVEIQGRYLRIGLTAEDEEVYGPTAEFLSQVGRMKFVRPL